jgi:hypothetical protein
MDYLVQCLFGEFSIIMPLDQHTMPGECDKLFGRWVFQGQC